MQSIETRWQSRDDMKTVWLMIQLRQKFFEIRHKVSQVEPKFQYMFQELCWIEFRQDCRKWIVLAILLCIINQWNWQTSLILVVISGDENYMTNLLQIADIDVVYFEIEAIEIWLWIVKQLMNIETIFFVRIEYINSIIWLLKNDSLWDLKSSEFRI